MRQTLVIALNRAWRIVGTGLSFAVMGVGGLFLGLYACLVLRIFFRDRSAYAQAARRIVSCAFRAFVGFMSMVGVLRWSVQGLDHWRRDRGCLVVANHPTLIDIIFLLAFFEGADCVVKASVLRNPTWRLLVRAADYVSNEDVGVLLAEAARRLQAGRTVVIFPEGTRTVPGEPLSFGAAAGAIAVRAGCECLPVFITCTPPTLYKSLPWYRVPPTRADFQLRVLPPFAVPRATGSLADVRRAAHDFTGRLAALFSREPWSGSMAAHGRGSQPPASPVP